MTNSMPKRIYSDETRERMRTAALARYDANAQKTHERVRAVMRTIQEETAANQGIYPCNKGALSLAEIARRSKLHPITFHKARYLELANEVKEWLQSFKEHSVVGRIRVRKELRTRLQEWKQLYEDLREIHRISETDLAQVIDQLADAQREIEELRRRVADLIKCNVVPLRPEEG